AVRPERVQWPKMDGMHILIQREGALGKSKSPAARNWQSHEETPLC
ncbi:hypothetical protein H709_00234, partial [Bartonella bacilliformis CUSCO5]